jgi:hypothetical protein
MADEQPLRVPGFVSSEDLKFHLYVAKTKVNMLYQQIHSTDRRKSSTEIKIDAKVASVTRKTERESEPSDEEKLRAVLEELYDSRQVGSIEEPSAYVKGTFPMKWGLYNDSGLRPDNEGPLVYFSGFDSGILVGLGGSSKHVIGFYGATSTGSRSATPSLVAFLLAGLETGEPPKYPDCWDMRAEEDQLHTAMAIAHHFLRPPIQQLEFVAKVLMHNEAHGGQRWLGEESAAVILGTPLYVDQVHPCMEDDPGDRITEYAITERKHIYSRIAGRSPAD